MQPLISLIKKNFEGHPLRSLCSLSGCHPEDFGRFLGNGAFVSPYFSTKCARVYEQKCKKGKKFLLCVT